MAETLRDKIADINQKIAENTANIDAIKAKADEDAKALKEENKKLGQVVKKLEATEAQIASIFNKPDAE